MSILLERLKPTARRGSKPRCHWLTHGPHDAVAARLADLVAPFASVASRDDWMPEGFAHTAEPQLGYADQFLTAGRRAALAQWWLAVPRRANTPNWDLVSTCQVAGQKQGLLLVEAKAHAGELSAAGKTLTKRPSVNSAQNDQRHCQVDENHVDRPPRYWALARRGPTMLGIKNSRQPQLDNTSPTTPAGASRRSSASPGTRSTRPAASSGSRPRARRRWSGGFSRSRPPLPRPWRDGGHAAAPPARSSSTGTASPSGAGATRGAPPARPLGCRPASFTIVAAPPPAT